MAAHDPGARGGGKGGGLYFFPEEEVAPEEVERILTTGTESERSWVISNLLRYAQWDDIWMYVSREDVREIFPSLDLPENLRQAWGRILKIEVSVN